MAHPQQRVFFETIREHFPSYFSDTCVVEVGSLDINGNLRGLFHECDYTGVDVGAGPNVDLVSQAQLLDLPTASADISISAECMEHNPYWRESLATMFRITKPGGVVGFSCALAGRPEHGTPRSRADSSPLTVNLGWTYYRNLSRRDVARSLNLDGWFSHYGFWKDYYNRDLYFVGLRRSDSKVPSGDFSALESALRASELATWKRRWRRDLLVRLLGDRLLVEIDCRRGKYSHSLTEPVRASLERSDIQ
jgi:SAM-dependent methyltransferase